MKKLLLALAMLTIGGVAQAQDKGTEFKFGGEIMQRFSWDQNPYAAPSNGATEQNWLQRNMFHVNALSGDKLQAYFNFIQYSLWGEAGTVPSNPGAYTAGSSGVPFNAASNDTNELQVSEAWMWWKVSDMFSVRAGRQTMDFGAGLVISKNDWTATPYNVDAAMGRFSWDFLDLDAGGGKLGEGGLTSASGTDNEVVFYGLNAGFKTLPDFLKKVEVFALEINGDSATAPNVGSFLPGVVANATTGGAGGTNFGAGFGIITYGLHAHGDASLFDYRADLAFQGGKQKAATAASVDSNFKGNMFDLELGANFPEFMKARLFVNYHMDSGDDPTSTDRAGYQPLFYNRHDYGGLMNIWSFGNLTDIRIGLHLQPAEDTTVGVEANLLSRTKTGANTLTPYLAARDSNMFSLAGLSTDPTQSALGTEIDVFAKQNYGHGLSMLAQLGFASLGSYYKPTGAASPGSPTQLIVQGKYNF